jgi:hypothetical protein
VGQSKAQVAGDVVRTFAPAGTAITAHQVGRRCGALPAAEAARGQAAAEG